jgi:hypothetical protein
MEEAVAAAKIKPVITFHGLRHTWASLAVMGGMPLMVVARNLGHVDTSMVEKHYGHLAPSYVAEAVKRHAPRYGVKDETNVSAIPAKRRSTATPARRFLPPTFYSALEKPSFISAEGLSVDNSREFAGGVSRLFAVSALIDAVPPTGAGGPLGRKGNRA